MGEPGTSRARILLSGTAACFLAEPPTVFQWSSADRDVSHRGIGHSHDHGVAEALPRVSSLLFLWGHVPRVSRCYGGSASGARMRAEPSSDPSRGGVPCDLSTLRRAYRVPHRWLCRRKPFRCSLRE